MDLPYRIGPVVTFSYRRWSLPCCAFFAPASGGGGELSALIRLIRDMVSCQLRWMDGLVASREFVGWTVHRLGETMRRTVHGTSAVRTAGAPPAAADLGLERVLGVS